MFDLYNSFENFHNYDFAIELFGILIDVLHIDIYNATFNYIVLFLIESKTMRKGKRIIFINQSKYIKMIIPPSFSTVNSETFLFLTFLLKSACLYRTLECSA